MTFTTWINGDVLTAPNLNTNFDEVRIFKLSLSKLTDTSLVSYDDIVNETLTGFNNAILIGANLSMTVTGGNTSFKGIKLSLELVGTNLGTKFLIPITCGDGLTSNGWVFADSESEFCEHRHNVVEESTKRMTFALNEQLDDDDDLEITLRGSASVNPTCVLNEVTLDLFFVKAVGDAS